MNRLSEHPAAVLLAARPPRGSAPLAPLRCVARAATLLALLSSLGCATLPWSPAAAPRLVDAAATPETRALFVNLQRLSGQQVLFGHQDDLAYGVTWSAEPGRSDVRETAGAYPAVYGWDVARLEHDSLRNIDGVDFARMREWIAEGYRRGGVVTISWHMDNPESGGNSWDTTRAVPAILPGGARHALFLGWLDRFAEFAKGLRGPDRAGRVTPIPVIFRPYHEMTGSWFWWGGRHVTPEEYRALWRFTVHYLRDRKGVHNLLWAYAPNVAGPTGVEHYFDYYPGDEYVDLLGWDEYFRAPHAGERSERAALQDHLRWLVTQADARGKLAALTETGYETIPDSTWWTGTLLPAITGDTLARRISYVLVWRNANRALDRPDHYYAPFPGHPSAADFARFRAHPRIAFGDEISDLYRMPGRR